MEVLPWLLLVVALDLVVVPRPYAAGRRGVLDSLVLALLALSAAAAGRPSPLEGAGAALLILIPAYHAGTMYGRFGFLLTVGLGGGAFLAAALLFQPARA